MLSNPDCELCTHRGAVIWETDRCRVIRVDDPLLPGFCRVIWTAHVREMTDLAANDRDHLMRVVWAVEAALRACYQPDKINLASFGNVVPHLHWHVIPRWTDDAFFPEPIWGKRQHDDSPQRHQVSDQDLAARIQAMYR